MTVTRATTVAAMLNAAIVALLTATIADQAESRPTTRCDRPGTRTIVANRHVQVVVERPSYNYYACDRSRGSAVRVTPRFYPSPLTGSLPAHFRLVGRRLAYEEYIPSDERFPEYRLILRDFARRTTVSVRAYDERPRTYEPPRSDGVRDVALSRHGIAWTVAFHEPQSPTVRVSVYTLSGRAVRPLARGEDIDPDSLRIEDCRASWRQGTGMAAADVC